MAKIFSGNRAKLYIGEKLLGAFTSATWGVSYDVATQFTLGRSKPAAFTYTAQNAVNVSLTGFRMIGNGPFKAGTVPELKNLMSYDGITIKIEDRDSGEDIMTVTNCYCTGFSTGVASRAVSDLTISFLGETFNDEFTKTSGQGEEINATKITDGGN